jgi:glycosyltransferase involved in cell wall biosynthesis
MTPRISVIMPCLNSAQHIGRSVASVLAQTLADFELLVVDNGSTDHTLHILASIRDSHLRVMSQPKRGVSLARNLGLRNARGEYIAFLDSDDTWSPTFLEKMHGALAGRPEAVLAYCGWQNLGLLGPRGEPFVPPDYETPDKAAQLLEGCRWPIHGALTRHAVLADIGGFNTRLVIAEDYLLWMEVAARGALVRVPEVLAQYHHHGGVQATQNRTRAALDTFRAKQMFLSRHPELVARISRDIIVSHTWGKLIQEGNALHWCGDIISARPIFRKALLAGQGTTGEKLRMLPSLLPLWAHRVLLAARDKLRL